MITKTTRKTYSPAFKAKVVEEYLRGEHLLSEIAATHQVHRYCQLKEAKDGKMRDTASHFYLPS